MSERAERSAYLGQFSEARADAIAAELEKAGIAWAHKGASLITRFFFIGEWGVRMFVDAERLDDARAIAERTPEPGARA
jgi:hypothetical protein